MVGAVLLAVVGLSVPVGATSAAETCGATAQQWAGTFQGKVHSPYYTKSLTVRVGQSLGVVTTKAGHEHPQSTGALSGGKLNWATYAYEVSPPFGPMRHDDDFTTTSVTCAAGKVTAFSGNLHVVHAASGPSDATFSVS